MGAGHPTSAEVKLQCLFLTQGGLRESPPLRKLQPSVIDVWMEELKRKTQQPGCRNDISLYCHLTAPPKQAVFSSEKSPGTPERFIAAAAPSILSGQEVPHRRTINKSGAVMKPEESPSIFPKSSRDLRPCSGGEPVRVWRQSRGPEVQLSNTHLHKSRQLHTQT